MYMSSCLQTHQKRALDPITDGSEAPCGCWDLNSGPMEEQSVLLTAEPALQFIHIFKPLKKLSTVGKFWVRPRASFLGLAPQCRSFFIPHFNGVF